MDVASEQARVVGMSGQWRDRVGSYKLRRRVRSDPSGTVYKAKDARSGTSVMVKELAPELVADSRFLERLRFETGILARLDHPNCGRVLDLLEIGGEVYVVFERLKGRTLREVIASTALRPPQALALLRGSMVGLDAAHSAGLLHRSLRPESVILQPDGLVKLTGFGQPAYGAGGAAPSETAAGISPYTYIAPEQVVGAEADVRTDVYLAGVLGFELLAGRPPFTASDPAELLSMHLGQAPPKLTELHPGVTTPVAHMVSRAMAKAPDDRQQSVRDLIGQIDAVSVPLGVEWTEAVVVRGVGSVGHPAHGSPAAVKKAGRVAVSGGGRLSWRPLRVLVPGVVALVLAVSVAAYGYNLSWLGAHSGSSTRQISLSTAQGGKPGSHADGTQQSSVPPAQASTPPDAQPAPAAAPALTQVVLPDVQVSPLLLSAVAPTPAQSPAAAPPMTAPVPAPAPVPASSPSPSPPAVPDDESDDPLTDAAAETPDEDELPDPGVVVEVEEDAEPADRE